MLGFWLKALRRPTLDLTLATAPGLTTRIIERPGVALDDAELVALVEPLRTVAGRTLAQMQLSLNGEPEQVTHLGLVMVDPEMRGRGLCWSRRQALAWRGHGRALSGARPTWAEDREGRA